MSFKNKRISNMVTNSAKKEESNQPLTSQQPTPFSLIPNHHMSIRGSQEILKENTPNMLSPVGKKNIEEFISI
jgi:hypothetical protein